MRLSNYSLVDGDVIAGVKTEPGETEIYLVHANACLSLQKACIHGIEGWAISNDDTALIPVPVLQELKPVLQTQSLQAARLNTE